LKVSKQASKIEKRRKGLCQKETTPRNRLLTRLREAEVLLSQGSTTCQAARHLGITEQTYYRWRKEYGGMKINQAKRLKELEKENVRLKRLVADQALDNAILKDVAQGNL
jgi:transposase-like protein